MKITYILICLFVLGFLSYEVIELIVASVCIDSHPKSHPPSTSSAAFLHTLRKLSSFDWINNPLIIDFDGSITSAEYTNISQRFRSFRASDPSQLPIYIVTSAPRSDGQYALTEEEKYAPFLWDYNLTRSEFSVLMTASKYSFNVLRKILSNPLAFVTANSSAELDFDCMYADFLTKRTNVVLKFCKDVVKKRWTLNGLSPSFATFQTYKNAPSKNISAKNLIVR